jgi:hypothetical protein
MEAMVGLWVRSTDLGYTEDNISSHQQGSSDLADEGLYLPPAS